MYDFNSNLLENEEILYQGRPVPGKGDKNLKGLIFFTCFPIIMQIILIWSVITGNGDGENGITFSFVIIFLVAGLLACFGLYGLYYNLIKKKKAVSDDFYCLTNIRVMKYESKKNKLVFGYLARYKDIHCDNVKDNFRDVYMGIYLKDNYDDKENMGALKDLMHPNLEDMPFIVFESIEHPYKVMDLAIKAKQNINII